MDSSSTPVSALKSERLGRDWLALADAYEANFFCKEISADLRDAAGNFIYLTPDGCATDRATVLVMRLYPAKPDEIMPKRTA